MSTFWTHLVVFVIILISMVACRKCFMYRGCQRWGASVWSTLEGFREEGVNIVMVKESWKRRLPYKDDYFFLFALTFLLWLLNANTESETDMINFTFEKWMCLPPFRFITLSFTAKNECLCILYCPYPGMIFVFIWMVEIFFLNIEYTYIFLQFVIIWIQNNNWLLLFYTIGDLIFNETINETRADVLSNS